MLKEMIETASESEQTRYDDLYSNFCSKHFTPRNDLDDRLYFLMYLALQTYTERDNRDLPSLYDKHFDRLLDQYGVPPDRTVEDDSGYCRDCFYDVFYEFEPNRICELSDAIQSEAVK